MAAVANVDPACIPGCRCATTGLRNWNKFQPLAQAKYQQHAAKPWLEARLIFPKPRTDALPLPPYPLEYQRVSPMVMLQKVIKEYGGFREAIDLIGDECLEKFSDRVYAGFCSEYQDAGYIKNVQWLLRHFYASKKMTLCSLFFTQTEELNGKNLKNLTFYTCYYSLFNALLSNLILTPYIDIEKIRKISHSQVFRDIDNYFNRFGIYDRKLLELLNELRLTRELYSYHLPLGGSIVREGESLNAENLFNRLRDVITPILQVSNLISYMSHYAWQKKVGAGIDEYSSHQSEVDSLFFSFIESHDHLGMHCVIDDDDYARQGYVLRKWTTPFPISWFITEKMCEDLECGWEQEDPENGFDISNVATFLASAIDAH
ncbi:MAG: hypothetical protein J0M09_02515 [Xanthomonadales bacterium]|nr:hypothetical protein [Xanthomonadales bacterium]